MSRTISERRADLGLSQRELADRLGVPLDTFRKWEYGTRVPKYKAMRNLAAVFGCGLEEIEIADTGRPTDKRLRNGDDR